MTPSDIKGKRGKSTIPSDRTYCIKHMYKLCKKSLPGITKERFTAIIDGMVKCFKERLFRGTMIRLPHKLGTLVVKRGEHKAYIDKQGRLRNGYPVDWQKTLELWCEDPEAMAEKRKVHNMNKTSSLYLVFTPPLGKSKTNLDVQFKRARRFIFEVTAYAEENKDVFYPKKKRYYER